VAEDPGCAPRRLGYPFEHWVGLILLGPIFLLILGFGSSEYQLEPEPLFAIEGAAQGGLNPTRERVQRDGLAGVALDQIDIGKVEVSGVDSSYAVIEWSGPRVNLRGGGIPLRKEGGTWTVVGAGTDQVGCTPSLGVPTAVVDELLYGC